MKLTAHFYLLNEHFSQEHADAQHGGQESENNQKIEWEDELSITSELIYVDVVRGGVYTLAGSFGEGKEFRYEVKNMLVFRLIGKDESVTELACSEVAVDSFELDESMDPAILKVYLKEEEPFLNPVPGIYIINEDFPEDLKVS